MTFNQCFCFKKSEATRSDSSSTSASAGVCLKESEATQNDSPSTSVAAEVSVAFCLDWTEF